MKDSKDILILMFIGILVSILTFLGVRLILNKSNNVEKVPKQDEKNYFVLKENGKEGVIDKKGNRIVEPNYSKIIIPNYTYPLFFAYEGDKQKILDDKSEFQFTKKRIFSKKGILREVSPIVENASTYDVVRPNIKYKENGKYGLMALNGIELSKPIYDEIRPVVEDKYGYLVKINGKEGILNQNGLEILKAEYDSVNSANLINEESIVETFGYVFSKKDEAGKALNGYVTIDGNIMLEPKYDSVNKMQIECKDHYIIVKKGEKEGVFRNQDKIVDINYDEIMYSNSYISAKLGDKYTLFDINGKKVNKKDLQKLYLKKDYAIGKEDDEFVIYDNKAKEIFRTKKIPQNAFGHNGQNYIILNEENGLSINKIEKNELLNVIGENEVFSDVQYQFDDIVVCQKNNEYSAFKLNEKKQLKEKYTFVSIFANTKIFIGDTKDGKNVFYDSNLDEIEGIDLSTILYIKEKDQNGIAIEANNEFIGINENGKKVPIKELTNRKIYPFKENNKYGYKDKDGKVIIEAKFERADLVNEYGFASIKQNGKWGVISDDGKVIVEPIIEEKNIADIYGEYAPIVISNYIVANNSYNDAYNLNNLPSLDRLKKNNQKENLILK